MARRTKEQLRAEAERIKAEEVGGRNELAELTEAVLGEIVQRGWVADTEFQPGETPTEQEMLRWQAIRVLDRFGEITQKSGPGGVAGWEATGTKKAVRAGRSNKQYGDWSPWIVLTMRLQTRAFAHVGEGRGPFEFETDAEGRIIFMPKYLKAVFKKAWAISEQGKANISEASINRMVVQPALLSKEADLNPPVVPKAIRRPVNTQGVAVGELFGKALAPGTEITWRIRVPRSHFTEAILNELLEIAQWVGFSPAGNGAGGGGAGIFEWVGVHMEPAKAFVTMGDVQPGAGNNGAGGYDDDPTLADDDTEDFEDVDEQERVFA